jgi:diguanylate cyclase (GGDEF)-like protein
MDIDRFKEVNDTLGHEVGDLLLRAVALRLTKSVRKSDTVARIGGDEFVIIMERVRQVGEADTVASKIERAVAAPYLLQRHRLNVTVSVGISFYPDNGEDPDMLLRAADYAMYLAKKEGGNNHLTCQPGTLGLGDAPATG